MRRPDALKKRTAEKMVLSHRVCGIPQEHVEKITVGPGSGGGGGILFRKTHSRANVPEERERGRVSQ